MLEGGSHLATVRMWMQRKFNNGDRVIWGSTGQPFIIETTNVPKNKKPK